MDAFDAIVPESPFVEHEVVEDGAPVVVEILWLGGSSGGVFEYHARQKIWLTLVTDTRFRLDFPMEMRALAPRRLNGSYCAKWNLNGEAEMSLAIDDVPSACTILTFSAVDDASTTTTKVVTDNMGGQGMSVVLLEGAVFGTYGDTRVLNSGTWPA